MFQRLFRAGSFRTYTLALCGFYLLLVFMFHSSLQPNRPRGINVHLDEEDSERVIGEKAAGKQVHESDEKAQLMREEQYAKQREQDLKFIRNDVKDQVKEQLLLKTQPPIIPKKVDKVVDTGLRNYQNLISGPPQCTGKDIEESPQFVEVQGDIFVYSVYWDERPNDFDNLSRGAYLRLMSIVKSRVAHMRRVVYCIFQADDEGLTIPVQASYYEMCENHNRLYGGYILSCNVPSSIQHQPCSIVLSSTPDPARGYTFKVQSTVAREKRRDFSVCVSPLFGSLSPLRIVEWLELTASLGAQHVTMYHANISSVDPALRTVVQHYISTGLLTVVSWPLRLDHDSNIWYHGQLVAVQDCLYRNMATSRYVVFNDLDEYFVPHTHNSWSELMAAVDNNNIAGFQAHSAFFDPSRQEDSYTGKYPHLLTLTDSFRSESTSRVRTKCLLKPQRVFEAGIHHISKPILAHLSVERVDLPVAVLHHYRTCMPNFGMNCHTFVKDTIIGDKYGDTIGNNVAHVLKMLKNDLQPHVNDEAFKQVLDQL